MPIQLNFRAACNRHLPSVALLVDDRMLVLFWIPILIISFAWAFVHALKIALHATKALVMLKVGLQA